MAPVEPGFAARRVDVHVPLELAFQVPESWSVVELLPDAQRGADVFPDDPVVAGAVDRTVTGFAGSSVVVLDPRMVGGAFPVVLAVTVQQVTPGTALADHARMNADDFTAAGIVDPSRPAEVEELADGSAVLRFSPAGSTPGTVSVQHFRQGPGVAVVFVALTGDEATHGPVVAQVAASLSFG